MITIKNFKVSIENKEILKGIDLDIKPGEIHAIMGPNGAGKTTLAMAIMGMPGFKIYDSPQRPGFAGQARFMIDGKDMVNKLPEEKAKAGLFVSFQSPVEITGVSILAFLRTAYKAIHPDEKIPLSVFKETVKKALLGVSLPEDFMQRSVNEGFSGGERKRAEIAQMLVLKPKFVILDEIDSGLDVDSLRIVAKAIQKAAKETHMGVLLITHYQRILHYVKPAFVHVLMDGKIKRSGGMELVKIIEDKGYAAI